MRFKKDYTELQGKYFKTKEDYIKIIVWKKFYLKRNIANKIFKDF